MESLDRRTFVQGAVVGGALTAVLTVSSTKAAGSGGYYVIAEIVAKPGSADALRALLVPFAEKSRNEPGCKLYTLLEVESEPGRFLTYERWTDKAALQVHMTTPHNQGNRPEARTCSGQAVHPDLPGCGQRRIGRAITDRYRRQAAVP